MREKNPDTTDEKFIKYRNEKLIKFGAYMLMSSGIPIFFVLAPGFFLRGNNPSHEKFGGY